ncbi:MAG: sulfatase [Bacteroidota bacterium]
MYYLRIYSIILGSILLVLYACKPISSQNEEQAPPNILFCIADDASFPHMGAYGTQWISTPAFDQVAAEGLLFMRAYTPNAKCAPSRSCIITGRNSWQLEEAANHWPVFPQKFKSVVEVLDEVGYDVGFTGKGWGPGKALDEEGNPRNLVGNPYRSYKLEAPAQHISTEDYARNFEAFLDSAQEDKPFFFWYGGFEPHRSYEFGAGINKGGKQLGDVDRVPEFWPDSDTVRTDMLDYAYEIEYFDQHLGRMLEMLKDRGLAENTLIVVTADNGMPFPRVKGNNYEMSNHLPLAISWPKGIQTPGREVLDMVSFIDFVPTFLDLAGVSPLQSGMQPVTGKSLTPIFDNSLDDGEDFRDYVLIGKERHDLGRPGDGGYPVRGIVTSEWLYLHNFEPDRWPAGNPETGYLNVDGSPTKTEILNLRRNGGAKTYWDWSFGKLPQEELYRLSEDLECLNNLVVMGESNPVKEELKSQLFDLLVQEGDPRILGEGEIFDSYPYSDEASRNFYERFMKGEKLNSGWVNPTDFEKNIE